MIRADRSLVSIAFEFQILKSGSKPAQYYRMNLEKFGRSGKNVVRIYQLNL